MGNNDNNGGWVKLYYNLKDWPHYGNIGMRLMIIHILLSANYCPRQWEGRTIGRGQFVTSISRLCSEVGLTVMQVRYCLDILEKEGTITQEVTNKYRVITICNYDKYQGNDNGQSNSERNGMQSNKQINKQSNNVISNQDCELNDCDLNNSKPSEFVDNKQSNIVNDNQITVGLSSNLAPTKEYKEIKTLKTINNFSLSIEGGEKFLKSFFENEILVEAFCSNVNISIGQCRKMAEDIVNRWVLGNVTHRDEDDARQHLINLIRKERFNQFSNTKNQTQDYETKSANRFAKRRGADSAASRPEDILDSF